ncbi:hypothetical protein N5853_00545 [Bartonella sp. HY329]|uniref:hypothetical protein n=1 Tax=unclassified Bartonella TaxID=2645622 RepID=UPI0021C66D8C|nr:MULTISPECIES: hypothetical protein [unclassified Bartonella]UXM95184.1 hypothetical protein N5853_00545 [Bartonella sp. HY329]UXN09507.1 hypothetical protein N5852_00550 [Bartonella sp. HY328]
MKSSVLALAVILATTSLSFAQNGRNFFGDGSPENNYVSGQHVTTSTPNQKDYSANSHVRTTSRESENSYDGSAGRSSIDYGRNSFGDGSPSNNH